MKVDRSKASLVSDITVDEDIDFLGLYQVKALQAPASGEALRKGQAEIVDADVHANAAIAKSKLEAGIAKLVVTETEVFDGTAPITWTDLNLASVVGANIALVLLKILTTDVGTRVFAVRKNGDADAFYTDVVSEARGVALAEHAAGIHMALLVATDAAGIIEWKSATANVNTTIDVIAYLN